MVRLTDTPIFKLITHDGETFIGHIVEADATNVWLDAEGPGTSCTFEWTEVRSLEAVDA